MHRPDLRRAAPLSLQRRHCRPMQPTPVHPTHHRRDEAAMTTDTDALRELLAAATPGPWIWNAAGELHDDAAGWIGHDRTGDGFQEYVAGTSNHPDGLNDGALIVAAVNALPDLLDERDRMLATIARVEALADEWERHGESPDYSAAFLVYRSSATALRAALAGEDA